LKTRWAGNTTVQGHAGRDAGRQRLLAATVQIAAERGYGQTTISDVVKEAGVPRPTFYEYFADKDHLFQATVFGVIARLLAYTREATAQAPPSRAAAAGIEAQIAFAKSEPAMARLLMSETLAAGGQLLTVRDRALVEIARLIKPAEEHAGAATALPDVSAETMLGAVHRVLASRLLRGERGEPTLAEELLAWLETYARPAGEHRWRALAALSAPSRSPFLPAAPLLAPPALSPRRAGGSAAMIENQRQRILFATAETVQARGYAATTVVEITRRAGVDGRAFYRVFNDKSDAFMAVHELAFQHTMAVTAGAFFAGGEWPERVWEAGRVLTQYLERNPAITHATLIESHAGGLAAAERLQDLIGAFTIFLFEGYQYPGAASPSALALEAVAAANLEVLYRRVRAHPPEPIAGMLGLFAHLSLAPFLGCARTDELIERFINGDVQVPGGDGREPYEQA